MSDTNIADLETQLLQAADHGVAGLGELLKLLDAVRQPSAEHRAALADSLELLIANPEEVVAQPDGALVVLRLAELGVEGALLRDSLSLLCRQTFNSWPDPAGLRKSLGIFDYDVPTSEIHRRWRQFSLLAEGQSVWHPSYRLGRIKEIDAFSDLVLIDFARVERLTLEQSLCGLNLVKAESTAAKLLADLESSRKISLPKPPGPYVQAFAESFSPPLTGDLRAVLTELLVPGSVTQRSFDTWFASRGGGSGAAGTEREWHDARSLHEMQILSKDATTLEPGPEEIAKVVRLFEAAVGRTTGFHVFAESVCHLWLRAAEGAEWVRELTRRLPGNAQAWYAPDQYVLVTDKLNGKKTRQFLEAAMLNRGLEWYLQAARDLPFRYLELAREVLEVTDNDPDDLAEAIIENLQQGLATPDAVVWLWNYQRKAEVEPFVSASCTFRVMARDLPSRYNRGKEKLQALVLNDADYLQAMTEGGTPEGIRALVRTVKTQKGLDTMEQQSILVKLVRLFPEAKELVEERRQAPVLRELTCQTSFRSMHELNAELQEIVNKKIPDNSAQVALARSYGDLRENAEYKAAKEMQRLLMTRRRELERIIERTQPTDFADVVVRDVVVPGCTINLAVDGQTETFHLLGLYDSDPERRILSYDSPLGKRLLGRKLGEEMDLPDGRKARVDNLQPLSESLQAWVAGPQEQS